jgi:hypothetical protein
MKRDENKLGEYLWVLTKALKVGLGQFSLVDIHPGRSAQTAVELLRANKWYSGIYTMLTGYEELKVIETGESDADVQVIAYVLVLDQPGQPNQPERILKIQKLLFEMTTLINNNRWNLKYAFPARDLKTMDLYGLTYDPEKLVGMAGWNPSVQAYGKDLYTTDTEDAKMPNDISLWAMTWQQRLRFGKNIYSEADHPTAKEVSQILSFTATELNQSDTLPKEDYSNVFVR